MGRKKVDFAMERESALRSAYRATARSASNINIGHLSRLIASMPAPRFFVSEERAAYVVSQMLRGVDCLGGMRGPKRRMYIEIGRRVDKMRRSNPQVSMVECVSRVIYEPAPEFYLSPGYIADMLYRMHR